jgi:hypothetical protein
MVKMKPRDIVLEGNHANLSYVIRDLAMSRAQEAHAATATGPSAVILAKSPDGKVEGKPASDAPQPATPPTVAAVAQQIKKDNWDKSELYASKTYAYTLSNVENLYLAPERVPGTGRELFANGERVGILVANEALGATQEMIRIKPRDIVVQGTHSNLNYYIRGLSLSHE